MAWNGNIHMHHDMSNSNSKHDMKMRWYGDNNCNMTRQILIQTWQKMAWHDNKWYGKFESTYNKKMV